MSRSLSMVLAAPIDSAGRSIILGTKICRGLESAKPPAKALGKRRASTPAFCARRIASAITAMLLPTITWLHSLVTWPAPEGPIRLMLAPYAASTGLARSNAAASPPHMMASVPSAAPLTPPETGASIHSMPLACFRRCAKSRVLSGRMLAWSTSTLPLPAALATPSAPNTTSSTALASNRHIMMMSAFSTAARGLSAAIAPSASAGASLGLERFHTCT